LINRFVYIQVTKYCHERYLVSFAVETFDRWICYQKIRIFKRPKYEAPMKFCFWKQNLEQNLFSFK